MSFTTDVLEGVAQWLSSAGIGTWRSTGVYTADETGIVLRAQPQTPDRVLTLSTYSLSDDPSLSDSVVGLQVITRWGGGDPRPNDDLADQVFDLLHGATQVDLSTGLRVVQALHRSGTSLGQDANQRWRTSSNYALDVYRPSPNRT